MWGCCSFFTSFSLSMHEVVFHRSDNTVIRKEKNCCYVTLRLIILPYFTLILWLSQQLLRSEGPSGPDSILLDGSSLTLWFFNYYFLFFLSFFWAPFLSLSRSGEATELEATRIGEENAFNLDFIS